MNKTEVLEHMAPILNTQVREVEHNPRTRVAVAPDMVTFRPGGGARTLEMTKGGIQSLSSFVGLPWNVATKLRPETFGAASTELLRKKGRYSLTVKDGAVVSVDNPREFHMVNPERALRAIEGGLPNIDYHRVLLLDNFVVCLEIVGDRRQPVNKGDLIQAGANITFSPLGTVNPMVQSYIVRLACTNGMTSNTVIREFQFSGGDDGGSGGSSGSDNIWQWFRGSVREAYGSLDRIVSQYRRMIDQNIAPEDRATILEAMLKEAGITGKYADTIRALAIESPPENSYEMINLISYASSHIIENPHQIRRAQLAVANHTNDAAHTRVCPACHHSLN